MGFVEDLRKGILNFDFSIPYGPSLWRALRDWPAEKLAQFNLLLRWSSFPCDELNWWVYVETALPALGEFVLVLVDFDWDDIARGYLRPVGVKSCVILDDIIKAGFKKKFQIPELGEVIGARLPGARIVKSITAHPLTRALFKIDAFLQRGLFYWLLLDVTTDFFYNWAVGLFRNEVCAQSGAGAGYCDDQFEGSYIATDDKWWRYEWGGLTGRAWRTEPYVCNANFNTWGRSDADVYLCGMRKFQLKYPPDATVRLELAIKTDDGVVLDWVRGIPGRTYGAVAGVIPAGKTGGFFWRVISNKYPVRITAGPSMVQGWALTGEVD